jgi:D-erythrulose 4-kinase
MTTLTYDATRFADDALTGILAAHSDLRKVDGGVVRREASGASRVAVVIGGGSGHYPAFAGLVGAGLATGAAYGNIFASPSAGQVYRVAQAAETGAGVFLSFGNYAGDVLNFGQAAERLRADGIRVTELPVTDDVASAAADDRGRRRGIAGDLIVFKVAGAAAERGDDLERVTALATRANANTFTFGVSFSGCTLPGAVEPLFDVAPGRMAVGLGIHGEPGISESALPTPDALARLLVERLLAEKPEGAGDRAVVLLNGLGLFKYEELYVLYGLITALLADAGVAAVYPEVGELVTSLDMDGVSLTLFWADAELEQLWTAPVAAPAFTRLQRLPATADDAVVDAPTASATPADTRHADLVPAALGVLEAVRDVILAGEEEFGRIDAIAGDGDHGIGMARGVTGAVAFARASAARGAGLGTFLADAGDGWSEHGGGTSGALWGVTLTALGTSLTAETTIDVAAAARAATAALDAVQRLGKAQVGDKTLVDAFAPFAEALTAQAAAGAETSAAWDAAATAAETAAEGTATLLPRLGRARPHAEKSVGHPDAGAVSFARIVRAVAHALQNARPRA